MINSSEVIATIRRRTVENRLISANYETNRKFRSARFQLIRSARVFVT
jgi:hypothetical protein